MSYYVDVKVEEIQPGGILVSLLEGNRVGFIRWDELTWDRSVRRSPPVPEIGSLLKTVIVRAPKGARYIYLSVKRTTDPWKGVERRFNIGDVVRGEVVSVREFGMFVQLEPGVDGFISNRDFSHLLLRDGGSLSVGDHVECVITRIDLKKRQIDLDFRNHLRDIVQLPPEERLLHLTNLFQSSLDIFEPEQQEATQATGNVKEVSFTRFFQPISTIEAILFVDDNPSTCQSICEELQASSGAAVDVVQTREEALSEFEYGQTYQLAIIDLSLGAISGIEVAEELLERNAELGIILVSANAAAEKDIPLIKGRRYPFALKQLDEILYWFEAWQFGFYEAEIRRDTKTFSGRGQFIHELGMVAMTRSSLSDSLHDLLRKLQKRTNATRVMVLEIDSEEKRASVIASEPQLEKPELAAFEDGLYYSPVRNVVEENHDIYRKHISSHWREIKNFYPLLNFHTFLGMPLNIPGFRTRYALFLFDDNRTEFELEDIEESRLAAQFVALTLEREQMLKFMRRFEMRYTLGQLQGSLVHELNNQLSGILPRIETLERLLYKAQSTDDTSVKDERLEESGEVVSDLYRNYQDIDELLQSYARLARDDLEAVDVNVVVEKIVRQFATAASDASIEIRVDLYEHLPKVRSIPSRLEQILTNLLLNAVAQTEKHRKRLWHQIFEEDKDLPPGLILLQTRSNVKSAKYPVQIVVSDTGPGIHFGKQEEIFSLDTSERRQGHGLGLFISRSLAETMGGGIRLVESFMYFGSAFVVDLPIYTSKEEIL